MNSAKKRTAWVAHRTAFLFAASWWLVPSIAPPVSAWFLMCEPLSADDNQRDELVETVIAGITQNYARLETVRFTLNVTSKHLNVNKEERERFRRDDGALVTIIRTPQTSEVRKCVLRDKDIRVESSGKHRVATIVSYHEGLWTAYAPANKLARISLRQNVGETLPTEDPRNIGIVGIRRSLTEAIRQDTIKGVERVDSADGTMLIRIELEDSKGREWFLVSDPSRGFLPKVITYVRASGNVAATTEFAYQEPIEGAWFLQEATQRLFDVETEDCLTVISASVRDLVVNESVDEDVFHIAIPVGVRVYDESNPEVFTRGRGQVRASDLYTGGWTVPIVLFSSLCALGILLACFYFRHHIRGENVK